MIPADTLVDPHQYEITVESHDTVELGSYCLLMVSSLTLFFI